MGVFGYEFQASVVDSFADRPGGPTGGRLKSAGGAYVSELTLTRQAFVSIYYGYYVNNLPVSSSPTNIYSRAQVIGEAWRDGQTIPFYRRDAEHASRQEGSGIMSPGRSNVNWRIQVGTDPNYLAGTYSELYGSSRSDVYTLASLALRSGGAAENALVFDGNITGQGYNLPRIYYRYRAAGEVIYSTGELPGANSFTISLTGLAVATTYTLQASFNADFTGTVVTTTGTTLGGVGIASIDYSGIGQTEAVASITIQNAGTRLRTVYFRFRATGGEYGPTLVQATNVGLARFTLVGLQPGTTYDTQAALDATFTMPFNGPTFDTPGLAVTLLELGNISSNSARIYVGMSNPIAQSLTVNLRWRIVGNTEDWLTRTATTNTEAAVFDLTDLEQQTSYNVEASLIDSFPTGELTLTKVLVTATSPQQLLRVNESVRLDPNPTQYGYGFGDVREFDVIGEATFFPVTVSTDSQHIRITASFTATCDTAGFEATDLPANSRIRILVCADRFGNATLKVDESSSGRRLLARYSINLDRTEGTVITEIPEDMRVATPPGGMTGDSSGLGIIFTALCTVMQQRCDIPLLTGGAVMLAALAATVIPTMFSLQTGFPVGTSAFGIVLGILVLTLGYLLGALPLAVLAVSVLVVALIGGVAIFLIARSFA